MLKFVYSEIGYNILNEHGEVLFREVPPVAVFEYLIAKSSSKNFNYDLGYGTILLKSSIDKISLYVFSKGRNVGLKYQNSHQELRHCELYIPDIVTLYNVRYLNDEYSLESAIPVIVQTKKDQVYDFKKLVYDIQTNQYPVLPFTNIYDDGKICFGQVKLEKTKSLLCFNSDFIYNYFFNSVFNSDLFNTMITKFEDIDSFGISYNYNTYYESLSKLSKSDIDRYIRFISGYTRKIVLY